MENLSSFKYKRRCSIFKNDLETKREESMGQKVEADVQRPRNDCHKNGIKSNLKTSAASKHSAEESSGGIYSKSLKNVQSSEENCSNSCESILDECVLLEKDDTEFRFEILKEVFKDAYSEEDLLNAVRDKNGLDHAVSVLLDTPMEKSQQKDCTPELNRTGSKSSESSISKPSKGQKRLFSDDTSPVELCELETPSKHRKLTKHQHPDSSRHSTVHCLDDNLIDLEKEDLERLKELFPDHEDEELCGVLESTGGCLDDAIAAMLAFSSPQKKSNSNTSEKPKRQKKIDVLVLDDNNNDLEEVEENNSKNDTPGKAIMVNSDDSEGYSGNEAEYTCLSSDDKSQVLSMLNFSEVAEIALVRTCSRIRAEKICSLRPFNSWTDVMGKFRTTRGLSEGLLWEFSDFLNERSKMENLMDQCEIISKDICGLFDLETSNEEDSSDDAASKSLLVSKEQYVTREPSIVAPGFKLKTYQLTGLNWLIALHKKNVNGILADEMGLGKTVQAIVFLAHLIEQGETGPHLIVVPASTCDNWKRELEQWCPSIRFVFYSGSQQERKDLRDEILYETEHDFEIVLTTYNMAISSAVDRSFLRKLQFHYSVFDEAHMLKNMKSQRYQYLLRIRARRMLLLTGTPIQNNLLELMSLLTFLMPSMFSERVEGIRMIFGDTKNKSNQESLYEREKVSQAKKIMEPFVMRRLKKDVLDQLPEKHEHLIKCQLPSQQRKVYNDLFESCFKILKSGDTKGRRDMVSLCMQLRKAANHGLLQRSVYDDSKLTEMAQRYCKDPAHRDSDVNLVFEDMQVMSDFELSRLCLEERSLKDYELPHELIMECGKFIYLDTVLPDMKKKGDRVLLFSQFTMMMDIAEVYLQTRNYKYLRLDGSTIVSERQGLIDRFNTDEDIFIFLLSTKAGGLGINLTSANVVILYDSDYNPHNDKQAEDRCHRLGQTR